MKTKILGRASALAGAALMLAACVRVVEPDAARVDCGKPGPHGVDCAIRRTGGTGGFEACWDLAIACRNGGVMTGSACHGVAAGANGASMNMPVASFSDQARCDVPASGKVERLKIRTR